MAERTMSAASRPEPRPMTVAEFLEYDDGTDTRYELIDGQLVAKNPPATKHVQIC
jgi:Uma2 family endonuclease